MNVVGSTSLKKYAITKEKLFLIADAYIWGIYTYQEMSDLFNIPIGTIEKILKDKKLFEELLDLDIFNTIQEKTKFIIKISGGTTKKDFIKNHECRKIVNYDVYVVSPYIKKIIELVNEFMKCNGNSEIVAKNNGKNALEVNASLHCNELSEYLLPEVYSKFQTALSLDGMFINRKISLIKEYLNKIYYMLYVIGYSKKTAAAILGIDTSFIYRLFNDPYVKIKIKDLKFDQLSEEKIRNIKANDIADFMIEKNLSLRETESMLDISYSTIYSYVLNKKYLTEEKHNAVKEMLSKRTNKTVENTDYLKIIKQLRDNKYSTSEIAKCVNRDKATISRILKRYYNEETCSTSKNDKNLTKQKNMLYYNPIRGGYSYGK